MPELGMSVSLTGATVATAFTMGVAAVGLAPLLTARKLRRMDVREHCESSNDLRNPCDVPRGHSQSDCAGR